MFEIPLLFFQAVLPVFTTFNLFLQGDDPQIYILYAKSLKKAAVTIYKTSYKYT